MNGRSGQRATEGALGVPPEEPGAQPDPTAAAAPARAEPIGAPGRPVFIHSSWRTSSTWFWLKFRENPATLCFYEPLNESLARLTREQAGQHGPQSWRSGHPSSLPYYIEFLPLIRRSGGARLFAPAMAFDWFVPEGGIGGQLRLEERRYLALLLRQAARRDKVAVLGFTRSLGRLAAMKREFAGTHVFLYRNLWAHWASYRGLARDGNPYFLGTNLWIMLRAGDPFLTAIVNRHLRRAVERGELAPESGRDLPGALLAALPEPDLFRLFMALHLYLYAYAELSADVSVDVTRLARDGQYRARTSESLRLRTGLPLDLRDVKEPPLAHWPSAAGIQWPAIREDFATAVETVPQPFDAEAFRRVGRRLINEAMAEMRTAERVVGRARDEIQRLEETCGRLGSDRDALAAECDRLARDRDGALAQWRRAGVEGAALAQRLAAERDAAIAERDVLFEMRAQAIHERDAAQAEQERLAREYQAAVVERDRSSDAAAQLRDRLERDRERLAAELEDAQKFRVTATAHRDALAREVAATGLERQAAAAQRDALAAEFDELMLLHTRMAEDLDARTRERDSLLAERDHLAAERAETAAALTRLRRRSVAGRLKRLARQVGFCRAAPG